MKGKNTCRILKEIRRQIEQANHIDYSDTECHYKGDCLGTCPKCESEIRYLEQELARRKSLGQAIAIAGLSVGMITGLSKSAKAQSDYDIIGRGI